MQTTIQTKPSLQQLAARLSDVSRLRILQHPFSYYAEGNTLVRMTSGDVTGMEGYRIRIHRDRKLVVDLGDIAVAIVGIFRDTFEEVEKTDS